MALKYYFLIQPILDYQNKNEVLISRRMREGFFKCCEALMGRPIVEQPLVQILVVVANTQVRHEKA